MIGRFAVAPAQAERGRELLFEHLQLFASTLGAARLVRLFRVGKLDLQLPDAPTAVSDLRTRIQHRTRVAEVTRHAQAVVSRESGRCAFPAAIPSIVSHQVMDVELLARMRQ